MNIEVAPAAEKEMTYSEAILYCQFLEYNGYRDWRMLTKDEYEKHGSVFDWYYNDTGEFSRLRVAPVRYV